MKDRIPNQDKGCIIRKGNVISLALCDGAGSLALSSAGAREISKLIAEMICNNWEHYRTVLSNEIRKEIYLGVCEKLKELSHKYNCGKEEFGSTILALATDGKECIGIHLGDGAIFSYNNAEIKILSYPVNGVTTNQTYLTTSKYAFNNIRFYRFKRTEKKYMLITDGIRWWDKPHINELFEIENEKKAIDIIKRNYKYDDASLLMIDFQED